MAYGQMPRSAVGLRVGGSVDLIYEYHHRATRHWQFALSLPNYDGVSLSGIHYWRLKQWKWSPDGCDWFLDAGVGPTVGVYHFDDTGFLVGAVGACAMGCRFKRVPISLAIDYKPVVGAVVGGSEKGFFTPGLWNFGLVATYHF